MRSILIGVLVLLMFGCSEPFEGQAPALSSLSFPLAMATDGGRLYVVNTNFDLDYRSGWISVVDLDSQKILVDQGVVVDSYGGDLVWGPKHKKLYLPTRENSTIYTFDVTNGRLECDQDPNTRECSKDYLTLNLSRQDPELGDEEYDVGKDAFSACVMDTEKFGPLLFVSSISDAFLAVYSIASTRPKFLTHILLTSGVVDIACDEENLRVFAAHRSHNAIDVVKVEGEGLDDISLYLDQSFGSPMSATSYDYFRRLLIGEGGGVLYATIRSPESLLVFDIARDFPRLIKSADLPPGPAALALLKDPKAGSHIFIVCSDDNSVVVMDTTTLELERRVVLARQPYDILIIPEKKTVAISCFRDSSVALLDWTQDPGIDLKVGGWIR